MKIFEFLLILLLIPNLCFGAASRSFSADTSDKVAVADAVAIRPGTSAWTTSIFMNASNVNQQNSVFTKRSNVAPFNQWSIFTGTLNAACDTLTTGKTLAIALIEDFAGNKMWCGDTASTFIDGTWHQFTLQRPSTDTAPNAFNNAAATTLTQRTNLGVKPNNINNTIQWEEGNRNGVSDAFNGVLSHAQVWNRQINQVEVAESFFKPGMIPAGLVFWTPIWGDSPERDLSGNGRTGTVTGTTTSSNGPSVMFGGGLPL